MLDQCRATFELIGGVPRMATEADENPWEFYRLKARLEISEKQRDINVAIRLIQPALPPTPLDGEGAIDVEFAEVPPGSPQPK